MAHITVVTTVYNRIDSIALHLHSLAQQTERDFHVVVADDGSTEPIGDLVAQFGSAAGIQMSYLRLEHSDPLLGVRARNLGCAEAPPETTHLWLTDGDIVFNRNAVRWAYKHIEEEPNVVIAGRYDWMPKMTVTPEDLATRFDDFVNCRLPHLPMPTQQGGARAMEGGKHSDPRSEPVWADCHKRYETKTICLGSNLIVPIQAWKQTGGYDENMPPACNAGDCEFGFNLNRHGWENICCAHIIGYHLYHDRNPVALTLGARKGLVYIGQKYGHAVDYKVNLPKLPPGVTDEFSALDGSLEETQ